MDNFEKMKWDLPEVNTFTQRKDLLYQQAFFIPKRMEKHWMRAVKEGEALLCKTKDERITYMKIKYPLVKYAESVANGRLVPNERVVSMINVINIETAERTRHNERVKILKKKFYCTYA